MRRRDARAGHRARLARRRPARRRGVADRLGEVLLRARPRPRLPHDRRRPLPRDVGAAGPLLPAPGPAGQRPERGHRPPDRQLDLRLAGLRRAAERARAGARRADRRRGAPRARHADPGAQPPHARAVRARDRRARLRRRRAPRPCGRGARSQPGRGLPARRRAPRVLDALPHDRPALVRRAARERPPPRRRPPARLRRPPRPRRRVRPPLLPARRHDPGPLGRRQRRLHGAARAARRRARGRRRGLPGRRLLHAAQRRQLPDLRLRPARRRRPRPLRPAQLRGLRRAGGRWSSTPAATRTPRASPTCATGSRARPRTTPSASTGSTRRPYARKAPKGPTAEPRFLGRTNDQLAGEAHSPAYEAVHRRTHHASSTAATG